MDWDEPKSAPGPAIVLGDVLDNISLEELRARLQALRTEIERVERELSRKQAHQSAAADIFKS